MGAQPERLAVMADDPKPGDPAPDPEPDDDPKPDDQQLREMRTALRKANKEAADARTKLKDLEDKDKSEGERAQSAAAAAEKRAEAAEARALRLEVATRKGLNAAQAKRLVGSTEEELEADADEILESFKPAEGDKPPVPGKPTADLKGGGDPTEDVDVNVREVIESIPRGF